MNTPQKRPAETVEDPSQANPEKSRIVDTTEEYLGDAIILTGAKKPSLVKRRINDLQLD